MAKLVVEGEAPDGRATISALIGCSYKIGTNGDLSLTNEFEFTMEPVYRASRTKEGRIRPSLLVRDFDCWSWKEQTDLVIQGSARFSAEHTEKRLRMSCAGNRTQLEQEIALTGDRRVERRGGTHVLSDPVPFSELPISWERAYGGTDELAEARYGDSELREIVSKQFDDFERAEWSEFSYPRNPAGRGYLVRPDGLEGLVWPNLEYPDQRLTLDSVVKPLENWGERPIPACWDWSPGIFFPRIASIGSFPPTANGESPEPEVSWGLLPKNLPSEHVLTYPVHRYAQGAHPTLSRSRLIGDERIEVNAMGLSGGPLVVQLNGQCPIVSMELWDGSAFELQTVFDLVHIEGDSMEVRVVWRGTAVGVSPHRPVDWMERSKVDVRWAKLSDAVTEV